MAHSLSDQSRPSKSSKIANPNVYEKIRTQIGHPSSFVVLGAKRSGKSRALELLKGELLERNYAFVDVDQEKSSPEEDYNNVRVALQKRSKRAPVAIFLSHRHQEYFEEVHAANGAQNPLFESMEVIKFKVDLKEAHAILKTILAEELHLDEVQAEGIAAGPVGQQIVASALYREQDRPGFFGGKEYKTYLPGVLRGIVTRIVGSDGLREALRRGQQDDVARVARELTKSEEHGMFIASVLGVGSGGISASPGFWKGLASVAEKLLGVVLTGGAAVALPIIGGAVGFGLWAWERSKHKGEFMPELFKAKAHWQHRDLTVEEKMVLGYKLERKNKGKPGTGYRFLTSLFDKDELGELSRKLESHLRESRESQVYLQEEIDKLNQSFGEQLVEFKAYLEAKYEALDKRVGRLELVGSVELTPNNLSERFRLRVKEEDIVGLGSGLADEQVQDTAASIILRARSAPVMMTGEKGVGKTTMLYLISKRLLDGNEAVRLIESIKDFKLTTEYAESNPREFLVFNAGDVSEASELLGRLGPSLDRKNDLPRVIAAVSKDDWDECVSKKEYSSKQGFENIRFPLEYRPEILEGIFDRCAAPKKRPTTGWQDIKKKVLERCDGSPFYIGQALDYLASKDFAEEALESLPRGVRELVVRKLHDLLSQRDSQHQLVAYYIISRYDYLPKILVGRMTAVLALDPARRFYTEVGDQIRAHKWYRDVFREILQGVGSGEDEDVSRVKELASALREGIDHSREIFLGLSRIAREKELMEKCWDAAGDQDRLEAIAWGLLVGVFKIHLRINPYLDAPRAGEDLDTRLHAALVGFVLHELFASIGYPGRPERQLMGMAALYTPRLMSGRIAKELGKEPLGNGGPTPSIDSLFSLYNVSPALDRKCVALVAWGLISLGRISIEVEDHGNQAQLSYMLLDYQRGETEIRKAVEADPKNPLYYFVRGVILGARGEYKPALEAYETAVGLDDSVARYHNGKGVAHYFLTEYQPALDEFNKALLLDPTVPASSHYNIGLTHAALEKHEEALTDYDRASALKPDDPDIYGAKGFSLVELGRYDEALTAYNQAIKLNWINPEHHAGKGRILSTLEKYFESSEAYGVAIGLDPRNPQYRSERGFALIERGAFSDAREELDEANRLDRALNEELWRTDQISKMSSNRHSDAMSFLSKEGLAEVQGPQSITLRPIKPTRLFLDDYPWQKAAGTQIASFLKLIDPIRARHVASPSSATVEWCKTPFYNSIALIRVDDTSWSAKTGPFWFLAKRGFILQLDGSSSPIHEANDADPVKITDKNALDYLRFFCYFVHSEEGPFLIVEDINHPALDVNKLDPGTRKEIESKLRPTTFEGKMPGGGLRAGATVLYGKDLYFAEFSMNEDGTIEMIDDEPFMADLPVKKIKPGY